MTARKRAEAALRQSEALYRFMFVDSPSAKHSLDGEGRIVAVSRLWCEFLGHRPEEAVGRHLTEFLTEEGRRAFRENWPRFLASGVLDDVPTEMVKRSGEAVDVAISARVFREGDKERDGNLDYGMLSELNNTQLVDSIIGSGTKQGYNFQATYSFTSSEFLWFATANPMSLSRIDDLLHL